MNAVFLIITVKTFHVNLWINAVMIVLSIPTWAHNFKRFEPETLLVRGGEWNTQSLDELLPYAERDVSELIYHEKFNLDNLHNDISLIFLQKPFHFQPHINIVCMPEPEFTHTGDCFAMGWGKDQFGR